MPTDDDVYQNEMRQHRRQRWAWWFFAIAGFTLEAAILWKVW